METPLLQTKLYIPPLRPDLIPRPHLIERLSAGLHHKLTLISAPAGSGKTTLITTWLHAKAEKGITPRSNVAWLSLDESDNDLIRFWIYIITALQTRQSNLGQTTLAILQSPSFNSPDLLSRIKNLLTGLINEIATQSNRYLLTLDDYHLIHTADIHHSLNFFLDHLPPQLHLVLVSREDPPFPLARLRVRQQITELRGHDLQFTLDEATHFLNQTMKLNLQPEAISVLERRTEGWVAGLQMAALSLQNIVNPTDFIEAFAGDDHYVVDYLIAEVLERQPPHVLDFLLQTSILKRFTASLGTAVTGQENAKEILAYLAETNLFLVALDNRREWYRYHHLFGDLLRYRLKQTYPKEISKFHRLAGRWYQEQDFMDEAIDHTLAGEDYMYAAGLIEQVGLKMIGQARLSPLQQWIEALPDRLFAERAYLPVLLAWVSALNFQPDSTESQLKIAEQSMQNLPADSKIKSEIICQVAMLYGYVTRHRRDMAASTTYIQQAIQFLPKDNPFLQCTAYLNLGGNYWILGDFTAVEAPLQQAISFIHFPEAEYPALAAAGYLTNAYLQRGRLDEATKICRQVASKLDQTQHLVPASAYVYIEQGGLLYEQNDLNTATDILSKAIQLGENLDRLVNIGRAFLLLAWIKQVAGQTGEAIALIERADLVPPANTAEFDDYKVRLWLAQGNIAATGQWARVYENRRNGSMPWGVLRELTYARVLLAEQKGMKALEILAQCQKAAQLSGVTSWVIRSLLLKALSYQALNDSDQALVSLRQALSLAEPEGFIRTFIDHGPPMQKLLQQVATQSIAPAYVAQLLTAFPNTQEEISIANQKSKIKNLVEPLNERELTILRLMATGLSNHEIAEELYLSINTVKWYTTHIYGKLDVKKRVEAVDRAHELGIL